MLCWCVWHDAPNTQKWFLQMVKGEREVAAMHDTRKYHVFCSGCFDAPLSVVPRAAQSLDSHIILPSRTKLRQNRSKPTSCCDGCWTVVVDVVRVPVYDNVAEYRYRPSDINNDVAK